MDKDKTLTVVGARAPGQPARPAVCHGLHGKPAQVHNGGERCLDRCIVAREARRIAGQEDSCAAARTASRLQADAGHPAWLDRQVHPGERAFGVSH